MKLTGKEFKEMQKDVRTIGIIALITTIVVLVIIKYSSTNSNGETNISQCHKGILEFFYFAWIICPPLVFLWEFSKIDFPSDEQDNGEIDREAKEFDKFKYSQDLASKFWAAIVVALTIILTSYFGIKDIKF